MLSGEQLRAKDAMRLQFAIRLVSLSGFTPNPYKLPKALPSWPVEPLDGIIPAASAQPIPAWQELR